MIRTPYFFAWTDLQFCERLILIRDRASSGVEGPRGWWECKYFVNGQVFPTNCLKFEMVVAMQVMFSVCKTVALYSTVRFWMVLETCLEQERFVNYSSLQRLLSHKLGVNISQQHEF